MQAASCWYISAYASLLQQDGSWGQGVKWMQQNTEKSCRKFCCGLQKSCNLREANNSKHWSHGYNNNGWKGQKWMSAYAPCAAWEWMWKTDSEQRLSVPSKTGAFAKASTWSIWVIMHHLLCVVLLWYICTKSICRSFSLITLTLIMFTDFMIYYCKTTQETVREGGVSGVRYDNSFSCPRGCIA